MEINTNISSADKEYFASSEGWLMKRSCGSDEMKRLKRILRILQLHKKKKEPIKERLELKALEDIGLIPKAII